MRPRPLVITIAAGVVAAGLFLSQNAFASGSSGSGISGLTVTAACPGQPGASGYTVTVTNGTSHDFPVTVSVDLLAPTTGKVDQGIQFTGRIGAKGVHSSSFYSSPGSDRLRIVITRTDTHAQNSYAAATFPCEVTLTPAAPVTTGSTAPKPARTVPIAAPTSTGAPASPLLTPVTPAASTATVEVAAPLVLSCPAVTEGESVAAARKALEAEGIKVGAVLRVKPRKHLHTVVTGFALETVKHRRQHGHSVTIRHFTVLKAGQAIPSGATVAIETGPDRD